MNVSLRHLRAFAAIASAGNFTTAAKQLHVIVASQCTGCELCLPPCPVDCIHMEVIKEDVASWKWRYPIHLIRSAA